jgi:hypothetical protein
MPAGHGKMRGTGGFTKYYMGRSGAMFIRVWLIAVTTNNVWKSGRLIGGTQQEKTSASLPQAGFYELKKSKVSI